MTTPNIAVKRDAPKSGVPLKASVGRHKLNNMLRHLPLGLPTLLLTLVGCASTTTVQLNPAPQVPVCSASASAQVFWTTQWRDDQKDVPSREAAAADGLDQFFKSTGCFKSASLTRLIDTPHESVQAAATEATKHHDKVVLITVRELGPTVKIGTSLALVEGATEVVLSISEYAREKPMPRTFSVRWQNGGPGVVKGIASLPQDMRAALVAALQPIAQ